MTLVRFNNRPSGKSFNNLMDDFFTTAPSLLCDDLVPTKQFAPVNIKETQTECLLEVIAPGLGKEDFEINLDYNMLTIEVQRKLEEENKTEKQIRREYKYQSFKRSFTVDENIDAENISAKYVNGVLTLNLPKKAVVKNSAKQISIQ